MSRRTALLIVFGLTLVGFLLRLSQFNQSLAADELSTYWILDGHSLGDVLSSIQSDDEITPPLYFVLGWLSLQVGPDPEWVRLPSLLAGTAAIPLVYVMGARAASIRAGLLGSAVMALSPFMIYYSAEARSYAVMIALVAASTVGLLRALDTNGKRWWALYAFCSWGAVLSHYTAVFPLAAQLAWALWSHREAIRPLIWANTAAAIGFLPWVNGFIADQDSPTTDILSVLSPFNFPSVRFALEQWLAGYPEIRLAEMPGFLPGLLIVAGVAAAAASVAVRSFARIRRSRAPLRVHLRRLPDRLVLLALLALAAPVGEAIFSAVGANIFNARNLNASWPGLAASLGALVAAAGPAVSLVSGALVLGGYTVVAAKTLEPGLVRPDYAGAAHVIEERGRPGDVVVDAAAFRTTPVPTSGLDVHLDPRFRQVKLGLPPTDEPYAITDPQVDVGRQAAGAYAAARSRSLYVLVSRRGRRASPSADVLAEIVRIRNANIRTFFNRRPSRFELTFVEDLPGLTPLRIYEFRDGRSR